MDEEDFFEEYYEEDDIIFDDVEHNTYPIFPRIPPTQQ
jgi:hypothetical protein